MADVDLQALETRFPAQAIAEVLGWALDTYGDQVALAQSFSVEDCVLHHLLCAEGKKRGLVPRIFTLDTGRLPEQSYTVLERLRDRYQVPVQVVFPQHASVEQLVQLKGPLSFYNSIDDRKECCQVRKLEPLGRALAGARAWIVGLRRAQAVTRAGVERFEQDGARVKISPLAHVGDDEIFALARELGAIVHPMHAQGYPSIGCAPCTRAIKPGEHPRAGRWWWESPESKECGLHRK